MNHIEHARKLRPLMVKAAQSLDDKDASEAVELFGGMRYDGNLIKAGTRINWFGILKQAAVDLWDYKENSPTNAPTLWDKIAYHEGIRIIPDVIPATLAWMNGELGWRDGHVYKSGMDGNVYLPGTVGALWEQLT